MTTNQQTYLRFKIDQRIEHVLLILSFTTLAITGLVQKFPINSVSVGIVSLLGGIEITRIIHRIAAIVFLLESAYHFILAGYKLYVQRKEATMLPGVKDVTDAGQLFVYNLGLGKKKPKMGRYNFMEKLEYWAMVWGLFAMGLTGFMLWNPIATTNILPGDFVPAAKAAHGWEAVLAVAAIILWHFYNVHLRHWNWSMIRGTLTRHEMEDEHAGELEKIEKVTEVSAIDSKTLGKRKTIYFPFAGVIGIVVLAGVFRFVTFEKTAITTIPPVPGEVEIFVPQTPTFAPTATTVPTAAPTQEGAAPLTWTNGIGALFSTKCKACHGTMGGLALDTYANAMKGGANGPIILPGDPDNSSVVIIQKEGSHPGEFDAAQLQQIIDWIKAGALDK